MESRHLIRFQEYKEKIIEILELMIRDKYEEMESRKIACPSISSEYRSAVSDFVLAMGLKGLSGIPMEILDKTEVFSSKNDAVNKNTIDVQLWFDGMESDLYAVFCAPLAIEKPFHLYDISVM